VREAQQDRLHRELFLAAFGTGTWRFESWVADRLTSLLEEQDCRAGETIFSAGEPPEFYYLLRSGLVHLVRNGVAPWTFEGPSVFGMADAVLDRPRVRTAIAVTDVEGMKIASEAWLELLEDSFPLARELVLGFIHTVAELEQRLWATGAVVPKVAVAPPPSCALDVIERLAALNEAPLLRGAGVQTLSDLAATAEVVAFGPGERLVERGKSRGRVVLVLEGEVDAVREAPRVEWHGGPGDIVCGTAAFGSAIQAWEALARTSGRALTFRVADWLDLMEEHFDMVRATLGALALEREELLEKL
jgi:CRP-like cAMP-binding protein